MDHSELDLLEQSIQRALERINALETENERLSRDRGTLEDRLKSEKNRVATITSSRLSNPATLSPDRLAEVKVRLQKLIDTIRDYEKGL